MLTTEQINQIRAKSGLPPKSDGVSNYVGKYDYLIEQPKKQSMFRETLDDFKQTGSALKNTYQKTQDKISNIASAEVAGEQGKLRSFGQTLGTVAGGISHSIGDVLTGAIKSVLPQAGEDAVKKGIEVIIQESAPVLTQLDQALGRPVGATMDAYKALPEQSKRDVDALMGGSFLALDLATLGVTKKAGQAGIKTGKKAIQGAKEGIDTAVETTIKKSKDLVGKAKDSIPKIIKPEPTPLSAAKEVLQGKTKDLSPGLKSIAAIDIKGVKTQQDFLNRIKSKISQLAKKVDTDLAKDKTLTKLKDLKVVKQTTQGADVVLEPVKTALKQLDELYIKIGDKVKSAEIKELVKKAKIEGLTKVEVNNLARKYGSEFGSKAFNKMGDALTSVNAKLFENTRKNLKEFARSGISGKAAQEADLVMTNLYNTKNLVAKNIEAVNKLQSKIRDRGLFEKFGYEIAKYSDLLTGGTLRGLVGGLLPRGKGYKVLNALDVEKALQKNLEIIQKAIKSNSDTEIINILNTLK